MASEAWSSTEPRRCFDYSELYENRQYICNWVGCHHVFHPKDIEDHNKIPRFHICPVCQKGFIVQYFNMSNLDYWNWMAEKSNPYNGFAKQDPFNALSADEIAALTPEEKARIEAMGPYSKPKESLL